MCLAAPVRRQYSAFFSCEPSTELTCVLCRVRVADILRGASAAAGYKGGKGVSCKESKQLLKKLLPENCKWLPAGKGEAVQFAKTGSGSAAAAGLFYAETPTMTEPQRKDCLALLVRCDGFSGRSTATLSLAEAKAFITKGEAIAKVCHRAALEQPSPRRPRGFVIVLDTVAEWSEKECSWRADVPRSGTGREPDAVA